VEIVLFIIKERDSNAAPSSSKIYPLWRVSRTSKLAGSVTTMVQGSVTHSRTFKVVFVGNTVERYNR
jgi:hypothetical protein